MAAGRDAVNGAQAAYLPDGRLHLHHGPIDIVLGVVGDDAERALAYHQAITRFDGLLEGLASELPVLRRPTPWPPFTDPVAQAMSAAVQPFSGIFVTPMAAVAGAGADAVLAAAVAGRRLRRAYANNGGDAALWLAPGERMTVAIANGASVSDQAIITAESPVRGVATSGWRGRSHSLGIADAVTVLARSAAAADVAATLLANAVNLPNSSKITRVPASEIDPDSDLGTQRVTRKVEGLNAADAQAALQAGAIEAQSMLDRGLIDAAALYLSGQVVTVGALHRFKSKILETHDG